MLTLILSALLGVPAEASSLFDRFTADSGGTVPNGIENLLERLDAFLPAATPENGPLVKRARAALIPIGRSRQAPACDFREPRVVVTVRDPRFFDRLFLAYAVRSNELEVISWDEDEGRFDFQLVRDFVPGPGRPQKILRNLRPACVACHQGGGPIFSSADWSESHVTGLDSRPSRVALRIAESVGAPAYRGIAIVEQPGPLNRTASGAEINEAVLSASRLLQSRAVARDACRTDLACRRFFLEAVLRAARGSPGPSPGDPRLTGFEATIQAFWPRDSFAYPFPLLVDRDPFSGEPLAAVEDPRTPRPLSGGSMRPDAVTVLQAGFDGLGFSHADLPKLRSCSENELEAVLGSREIASIIADWPLPTEDAALPARSLRARVLATIDRACTTP